jgi:hypothetical protein
MPWPNPPLRIPSSKHHFNFTSHADRSLRNICMRHWNETQPGGQGSLINFEAHFKSLSGAEKEVCSYCQRSIIFC